MTKLERIEKLEKQFFEVSKFLVDVKYKRNTCIGSIVEPCILEYWANKERELYEELKELKEEEESLSLEELYTFIEGKRRKVEK